MRVAKSSGNRVLMNIAMADAVVCGSRMRWFGEASLPDGKLGGEAVREAFFDQSNISHLVRGVTIIQQTAKVI